jgi:biopolymer transport protein ExbD
MSVLAAVKQAGFTEVSLATNGWEQIFILY